MASESGLSVNRWYQFRLRTLFGFQAAVLLTLLWGYYGSDPDIRRKHSKLLLNFAMFAPAVGTALVVVYLAIRNKSRGPGLIVTGALVGAMFGLIGLVPPVIVSEIRDSSVELQWLAGPLLGVSLFVFQNCFLGACLGGLARRARDYYSKLAAR